MLSFVRIFKKNKIFVTPTTTFQKATFSTTVLQLILEKAAIVPNRLYESVRLIDEMVLGKSIIRNMAKNSQGMN